MPRIADFAGTKQLDNPEPDPELVMDGVYTLVPRGASGMVPIPADG
jgi:hypothetical protein